MDRNENDARTTRQEPDRPTGPQRLRDAHLDRRRLMQGGGVVVAVAAVASVTTGCDFTDEKGHPESSTRQEPVVAEYSGVPDTPMEMPDPNVLHVLSPHEAATLDALTSRILPGTPEDPGAHEAGVVTYIDLMLSYDSGLVETTYRAAPYAQTPEVVAATAATPAASPAPTGSPAPAASPAASPIGSPPASPAAATATPTVAVAPDEIQRYGYQSLLTPRDVYRIGLAAIDRYATSTYDRPFVDLDAATQDKIVGAMAKGSISSFAPELSAQSFFQNLRRHTAEGMFSDPLYGGNRNLVGWKLVGYPGAQRAYMPDEFQREGTTRQPQGMADMADFHAGQTTTNGNNVILPVNGSDPDLQHASHP